MEGISAPIREQVMRELRRIEGEQGVKVFFACESGSRAWGFPSANSDFDVRFLYAHPRDWYLAVDLEAKRDVIEQPINDLLDISGWDLRKALQLFRKSNPPLLEWLQSPLIYLEEGPVAERLRSMIPTVYSPRNALYHYLQMARGNNRDYLQGETVWVKKYFYVLRPLLAVKWIEADLGPVPMEFDRLVERTVDSPEVLAAIRALVDAKRAGEELDRGPRLPLIGGLIDSELERLEASTVTALKTQVPVEGLNDCFRSSLDDLWSP